MSHPICSLLPHGCANAWLNYPSLQICVVTNTEVSLKLVRRLGGHATSSSVSDSGTPAHRAPRTDATRYTCQVVPRRNRYMFVAASCAS